MDNSNITMIVESGYAMAAEKLNIVPGLWTVEFAGTDFIRTVSAETPMLAAAKIAPIGSTLTLSASSVDCASGDTRLIYCDIEQGEFFGVFGEEDKTKRIYVKPLLAL